MLANWQPLDEHDTDILKGSMNKIRDEVLTEWRKKYSDFEIIDKLKSGKEADVWSVFIGGELRALKVYVASNMSTRQAYTEGQWINSPSLRKATKQKTKVGKDLQRRLWTKREYYLLKKLRELGATVPEVFAYTDDAILMQYLGDEASAAPRLIDIALGAESKASAKTEIERNLRVLLENGIVHADLSPYNILWWENKPWIIDLPQAADIRHNPNWKEFYERDVENIRRYFVE
jgi:RIO kinase 1